MVAYGSFINIHVSFGFCLLFSLVGRLEGLLGNFWLGFSRVLDSLYHSELFLDWLHNPFRESAGTVKDIYTLSYHCNIFLDERCKILFCKSIFLRHQSLRVEFWFRNCIGLIVSTWQDQCTINELSSGVELLITRSVLNLFLISSELKVQPCTVVCLLACFLQYMQ